jgi:hypothetical protein
MTLNMTPNLIPLPPFIDRLIPDEQTRAFDHLGPLKMRGFNLHRQLGTNWGTDRWFRFDPRDGRWPGGLTTYGQDAITGEVIRWNDPLGAAHTVTVAWNPNTAAYDYDTPAGHDADVSAHRWGWASGPVSAPYGDGAPFVAKYGVNAVNDCVSWEVDGFYGDPWSVKAMQIAAQACAHYAHNYGITWEQFPIHPDEGFSFVRWHQEYTIGTGKICPGAVVMNQTSAWIEMVRAVMKAYQTAGTEEPKPIPTPPTYTAPVLPDWWERALESPRPSDAMVDGVRWFTVRRRAEAIRNANRYSRPDTAAPKSGPKVLTREKIGVERWFRDKDGAIWIVEDAGHFVKASAFTPAISLRSR